MKKALFYLHSDNTIEFFLVKTKEQEERLKQLKKESTFYNDSTLVDDHCWNGKTQLILGTNVVHEPFSFPKLHYHYSVQLLKSALQKAIRRCKTSSAVRIAWQLMCQDLTQFLRRFPIIVMEDACLHPQFPHLIWFMIANSKKFQLSKSQVDFILKIVEQVANTNYKDIYPHFDINFQNPLLKETNFNTFWAPHIAGIILRVNYGGMHGDRSFLLKMAMIWYNRFQKDCEKWERFIKNVYSAKSLFHLTIDFKLIPELLEEDKLEEAIDFHANPKLLSQTIEEWNKLDPKDKTLKSLNEDEVRLAVWYNRSGINLKKLFCNKNDIHTIVEEGGVDEEYAKAKNKYNQIWNEIKKIWDRIIKSRNFFKPFQPKPKKETPTKKRKREIQSNLITTYFKKLKA